MSLLDDTTTDARFYFVRCTIYSPKGLQYNHVVDLWIFTRHCAKFERSKKAKTRSVCARACMCVRACEVSGGHSGTGCPCPGSSGASSTRAGRSSSWQTIALSIRPGNNHQFMEGKGGAKGERAGVDLSPKNAPWTELFPNKHTLGDCVAIVGGDLWNCSQRAAAFLKILFWKSYFRELSNDLL